MPPGSGADEPALDDSGAERALWDALVEQHSGLVWAVPRGLGLGADTATEVAHTAWLRVVERLDLPPDRLGAELASAARREAVRAARWQTASAPPPAAEPLLAALDRLPGRQRLVVRLLAAAPAPGDDALAAALDVPVESVAPLADAALARFADALDEATRAPELLVRLRAAALRHDPVPAALSAAARAALSWRTLASELAPLVEARDDAMTGVRSARDDRLLTFRAGGLAVDLQIGVVGGRRDLLGQLTPAAPAVVQLRSAGGSLDLDVDELGRFSCDGLEAGPVSLRVEPADGGVVHTEWTAL